MGHILGYVSYPQKDSIMVFTGRTSFVGRDGVEKLVRQRINWG
jgi:hypothetical protein